MSKKRSSYRIRNWDEYNAGLKRRGSLTFWVDEEVSTNWLVAQKSGKRGASRKYSELAIETVAMLKSVYSLAGRQATGLVTSIFELMQVALPVPEHSTVSRRLASLEVEVPVLPKAGARHVVVDATGIKIYGEGEWKTRQHGVSKRRTWRKLHLAVDEATGEILAVEVTHNDHKDGQLLEPLLGAVKADIEQVSADGAYDHRDCYNTIAKHGARSAIPPRKGAKVWQHGNCKAAPHLRDENLRAIRKHGRKKWKRLVDYHRRSLAETAMFRFKTNFSPQAFSRRFDNQVTELKLKCRALNKMIQLAKPQSHPVT